MTRPAVAAAGLLAIVGAAGCPPPPPPTDTTVIQQLEDRVAEQGRLLEQKDAQLRQQSEQIRTLSGVSADHRLDVLPRVQRIELASMSGGYDADRDGVDDGIVLYLSPIDQDGDAVKAAGSVVVRLLDLENPPDAQELHRAEIGVEALRSQWYGRFGDHYTIRIPWSEAGGRPRHPRITAVIAFTEYLTGASHHLQPVFDLGGSVANPDQE